MRSLRLALALTLGACTAAPAAVPPLTTTEPPPAETAPAETASAAPTPASEGAPAPPLSSPTWSSLAPVTGCSRSATLFVIDRSGSMSGMPIEMAKMAVKRAIATLDKDDCFGVVTFDSTATRVLPIAPVVNRGLMERSLEKLNPGGGTDIVAGLDAGARDVLAVSGAKHRAILLLTDGQSPQSGARDLVARLATEHVVLSTIGLGSGVDEGFLRALAEQGSGRSAKVHDPALLPGIVEREVALLRGTP